MMKRMSRIFCVILLLVFAGVLSRALPVNAREEAPDTWEDEEAIPEIVLEETEVVVEVTEALAEETETVVEETEAVVEETEAVVEETEAVVEETEAVVEEAESVEEEAPALDAAPEEIIYIGSITVEDGEEVAEDLYETTLNAVGEELLVTELNLNSQRFTEFTWFGEQLNELEKRLYDTLLGAEDLTQYAENGIAIDISDAFSLTGFTTEEIQDKSYREREDYVAMKEAVGEAAMRAMSAFEYDFPEDFWFSGCSYVISFKVRSYVSGIWDFSTITLTLKFKDYYAGVRDDIPDTEAAIEQAYDLLKEDSEGKSRAEIIRMVHDFIVDLGTYSYSNRTNARYHTITGILLEKYDHMTVCEGYAKLAKILLDQFSIPCVLVCGYSYDSDMSSINHMWNLVQLEDGSWYLLDCTWDDQTEIEYTYCMACGEDIGFHNIPVSEDHISSGYMLSFQEAFTYPPLRNSRPHEHNWTEWAITTDPGCEVEGKQRHECTECGLIEEETLKALGHQEGEWVVVKEALLREAGLKERYCDRCGELLASEEIPMTGELFTDVMEPNRYFYDPVYWAFDNGITTGLNDGTGRFGWEDTCSRAMIVTFLWRAFGSPDPVTTENPFVDVEEGWYFYKPVLWAVENNITTGLNDGTNRFGVDDPCTRAMAVAFLWRAFGRPEYTTASEFVDVDDPARYFYSPVSWALENDITTGLNDGTGRCGVDDKCSRSMIVTFLYRARKFLPSESEEPGTQSGDIELPEIPTNH